jgi:hypothetical protein
MLKTLPQKNPHSEWADAKRSRKNSSRICKPASGVNKKMFKAVDLFRAI